MSAIDINVLTIGRKGETGAAGAVGPAGGTVVVDARADLAELETTGSGLAFLRENGREGVFEWNPANLTSFVTNDPAQGVYIPPAGGTGSTGAWVRVVSGFHSVKWWGAAGAGVIGADHDGVQAAINYLSWLTGTGTFHEKSGATLFFPLGIYDTDTGWTLLGDGVSLLGESRRGSILRTSTAGVTVLTIGDPTYAGQTYLGGISNISFLAAPAVAEATDTTAICFHDVIHARLENLSFFNFSQGLECYRLNSSVLESLFFDQRNRSTVKANYAVGFFSRPTTGDTSGNNKIQNLEIGSASMQPGWKDGILITSADGAYFDTGHVYMCDFDLRVAPDGTNAGGNTVSQVTFDSFYFDTSGINAVRLEGRVVNAGGAVTKIGVYRDITFDDSCKFSGGDIGGVGATTLVNIRVTEAYGGLRNIAIRGFLRNADGTAITVAGAGTGFAEAEQLEINAQFSGHNRSGTALQSAITAEVSSAKISGVFGPDAEPATRIINLSGSQPQNILIGNCEFSEANCTGAPIQFTSAPGAKLMVLPNLSPLQRHMDYAPRHLHTADATPAALFSYVMGTEKVLYVEGVVLATTLDSGAEAGCWRVKGMWRRGPSGAAVVIVPAVTTAEGESTAGLDAVLAAVSATVSLNVTGLAGTTLLWSFVPSVIWGN